jgi:hypothetical protein
MHRIDSNRVKVFVCVFVIIAAIEGTLLEIWHPLGPDPFVKSADTNPQKTAPEFETPVPGSGLERPSQPAGNIAAATAKFESQGTGEQLKGRPANIPTLRPKVQQSPVVSPSFENLKVILQSLEIVNGNEYLLSVTLTNVSSATTLRAAVHCEGIGVKSTIRDPEGYEFLAELKDAEGVPTGYLLQYLGYQGKAVSLRPTEAVSGTIKYHTRGRQRPASVGNCKVRVEVVVLSVDGEGNIVREAPYNFLTEMIAQ